MVAIELKNISFSYDKNALTLNDVSLSINKGEYVSIVGHNGSGKSTLAKLLIGLLNPSGGSIIINGTELTNKTAPEIRKSMALVFQNPDNQFIGATIEDDIAFGLENHLVPHNEMRGIVLDFASKVGMAEYLDKEPSHLSGGQKQRVAIAGALALGPEILILDEATSMLDPRGKREIMELIEKLRKNSPELTIISITHDIEEAYQTDRVIAFNEGKVAYDGNPKDMFAHRDIFYNLKLNPPFILEMENKLEEIGIKAKGKDIDSLAEAIWQSK